MKSLTDELQDVRAERDVFQQKAHRLNVEMNHIVGNDDVRILDIDALCMENRFVTPFEICFWCLTVRKQHSVETLSSHYESNGSCTVSIYI